MRDLFMSYLFLALLAQTAYQVKQCSPIYFMELVNPLNYPLTIHKVLTRDGYFLTLFRIQAKNSKITNGKPPVFLQHGINSSADDWVINDEHRSPAFTLANRGYDVWLGNNRGNKYSLKHKTLDINKKKFWSFSFQEMGKYDIPANIEYILKATNKKKLTLIAHSQGATQIFAALTDPATSAYVNQKVNLFIPLAPVLYLSRNKSLIFNLIYTNRSFIKLFLNYFHKPYIRMHTCSLTNFETIIKNKFCFLFPYICELSITQYDNAARAKIMVQHDPSGTSVQSLWHFMQMLNQSPKNPVFQKYDFGFYKNLKFYGSIRPPVYNLSKITIPVRSFLGDKDMFADLADNYLLRDNCKKARVNFKQYYVEDMAHNSFFWGKHPYPLFRSIIKLIEKFGNKQ